MDGIRQYLLTVITAAVLCGILEAIPAQKGSGNAVRKLICGLFLTVTVAAPLTRLDFTQWIPEEALWNQDGSDMAAAGAEAAAIERNAIIKSAAETYILDKAAALEVSLTAEVTVSEDGTPESVILSGVLSPYARQVLSNTIASDLAIAKERQKWIG